MKPSQTAPRTTKLLGNYVDIPNRVNEPFATVHPWVIFVGLESTGTRFSNIRAAARTVAFLKYLKQDAIAVHEVNGMSMNYADASRLVFQMDFEARTIDA